MICKSKVHNFFSFAVSLTKTKKKGLELKTGLVKEVINIICLNDLRLR